MNHYLATKPFDLYAIHLFQLVVKHRTFTRAAREAGLSQSALTRQMQSLEDRLGVQLIERTTRSMELTAAGEYLARESERLVGSVASVLDGLHAEFAQARPIVRVGVSRTMAMAHMPGLFHANGRKQTGTVCKVSYMPGHAILSALDGNELEIGVFCSPPSLPESLRVCHRFSDAFTLICSQRLHSEYLKQKALGASLPWLAQQDWMMIDSASQTGEILQRSLAGIGLNVAPAMESDSFDLIINLVMAGMGVALVPRRALAPYRRKRGFQCVESSDIGVITREVVVAVRKHRALGRHVEAFIENILF